MKSSHNTTFDASKSSLLSSMFSCPSQSSVGTCNLCLRPTTTLKNHVSRHLEQVALFALPRVHEALGDEAANENDSIEAISQHELKQFGTARSDLDNEQLLPTSIFELQLEGTRRSPISPSTSDGADKFENKIIPSEQQSEGSDIGKIVDQDIIPDCEETSWDVITDRFSEARKELYQATLWEKLDSSECLSILKWISSVRYDDNHFFASQGRISGTGAWLLRHELYREWRVSSASVMLWLHGDREYRIFPGAERVLLTRSNSWFWKN